MFRLLKMLRPFTFAIIAVVILVFLRTLTDLFLPTLMSDIVDIGIVQGDVRYILARGGIMLLVTAAGIVAATVSRYLSARVGTGLSRELRKRVFVRVQNYSLHEFDEIGTASLITRTTNDITQVERVVIMLLRMMLRAPVMCIGGIMMAVSKDAVLSRTILVAVPALALVIAIIARKSMPLFRAMQEKIDKLNLILKERLAGIRVIRAFNRTEYEKERFNRASQDLTETAIRVNKLMASMMPLLMLLLNLTTVAVVWFGGIRIEHGNMQVGDLMAFIQYIMQIMFALIMFSMMFVMIPRASASADRINQVLDMKPEINDPKNAVRIEKGNGTVEFQDVTFCYPGAEEPVLEDISFTAEPGRVTAVIGSTGSGKSSLLKLIPRFYDVKAGRVLIDGVDVREMALADLRARIGLVSQEAVLFSGSVADNIRYGRKDATEEEMIQALKTAQADFVFAMEEGIHSSISRGGKNLSGGQKQRLSIARALIKQPDIYLFDDSFSALDFQTDSRLRQALKPEFAQATVIIVAQRVSTIMNADQIIVLDQGRIAGKGTHRELLRDCRVYQEIVTSQLAEEEL